MATTGIHLPAEQSCGRQFLKHLKGESIQPHLAIAYLILAITEVVCEAAGWQTGIHVLKPSLMPLLIGYWLLNAPPSEGSRRPLIAAGLLFSCGGDVAMMLGKFIPGLAAFLIAHLCYIAGFLTGRQVARSSPRLRNGKVIAGSVITASAILIFFVLQPHLGDMLVPVALYMACILAMAISALDRFGRMPKASCLLTLSGALLFMASDSVIALHRFVSPMPGHRTIIMSSYLLAQLAIVHGCLLGVRAHRGKE